WHYSMSITTSSDKDTPTIFQTPNPNHATWVDNDAHVRMLIISTISEASFPHSV
ncbi:hypothetical protein R6Q59_023367, partial [Mikania micrantha]